MKGVYMRSLVLGVTVLTISVGAPAAPKAFGPKYEAALAFTRELMTVVDEGPIKLMNERTTAARVQEINALNKRAAAIFSSPTPDSPWRVCVDAAHWATQYWHDQASLMRSSKSEPVAINTLARSGFKFGEYYRSCSDMVDTLGPPPSKAPSRIIDATTPGS